MISQPELEVLVTSDVGTCREVRFVPGLPEWLGTEAAQRVLANPEEVILAMFGPTYLPAGLDPDDADLVRAARFLARMMAALGLRESELGKELDRATGGGDPHHDAAGKFLYFAGWGPWQADINADPDDVAAIRALVVWSAAWWQLCLRVCTGIYLRAALEYPGHLEVSACRYNCSRLGVEAGLAKGDPNLHTTPGPSKKPDYGRDVMNRARARWPEMPAGSIAA